MSAETGRKGPVSAPWAADSVPPLTRTSLDLEPGSSPESLFSVVAQQLPAQPPPPPPLSPYPVKVWASWCAWIWESDSFLSLSLSSGQQPGLLSPALQLPVSGMVFWVQQVE